MGCIYMTENFKIHKILRTMLFGMMVMNLSISQANSSIAPQCHKLFVSEEALAEKIQALARIAYELKYSENKNTDLYKTTEKSHHEQLSEIVRINSRAYQMYLTELKSFNPRELQEKKEREKKKERQVVVSSVFEKFLKMEDNSEFSQKVISTFIETKIAYRQYVADRILNEWLKAELNTSERNFASRYLEILQEAVYEGSLAKIQELISLKMFDVNTKNEGGFSILLVAEYANNQNIIDWVIKNPKFNITEKNKDGFTDVELLRLMNKNDRADYIEQIRPESKSRKLQVKERNEERTDLYPDGTPIIAFIEIRPGTHRMGYEKKKTVSILEPYQVLSVKTTQKMWQVIVDLADKYINGKINLISNPSKFKGEMNPVETVSDFQVELWSRAASELSKLDMPDVQIALAEIFPGHQLGDIYRLPTWFEMENVARLGGLANGKFSTGLLEDKLGDYVWYEPNSGSTSHPVGLKKPVFVHGQPIYDLFGNVYEMTVSIHMKNDFSKLVQIGGSFESKNVSLGQMFVVFSELPVEDLGFRLARTRPQK